MLRIVPICGCFNRLRPFLHMLIKLTDTLLLKAAMFVIELKKAVLLFASDWVQIQTLA